MVAEEVRNLAGRASDAAKQITSLIENSNKRSQDGVKIADDVGAALDTILEDVRSVSDLIGKIATANQEQAQGIEQVTTAVSQMDKVTQQNAAGAEESASASEQMNAQMVSLKSLCDQFTISDGGTPRPAETAVTRRPAARRPAAAPKSSPGSRPAPADFVPGNAGEETAALESF